MLSSLVCILSCLVVIASCGPIDQSSQPYRIIGKNDLVPVHINSENESLVKAIGRMDIGCTVTHLGKGLAITAAHCIWERPFEGVRQKSQRCRQTIYDIEWGVTNDQEAYMVSECQEVIISELNDLRDYALIRVYPVPESSVPLANNRNDLIGSNIVIYSHPDKRPLEASDWCTIESLSRKSADQFGYYCDTEGGSSGAAVLNSNFEIVGIHNFYYGPMHMNGATYIKSTRIAELFSSL